MSWHTGGDQRMTSQSGPSFSLLHGSWESTTHIQDWRKYFSFQQSCPDPSISIFFYFSLCVYMHKEVLVDVENCPQWLLFLFIEERFLNQTTKCPIGYSVSLPILLWYVPGVCYQRLGLQWFSGSWHFHGSKNLACGPYICSGMQISPGSFYLPFHWLIKIIFYVSELFLW